MKVELFPFQKTALARLRQSVATALGNYRSTHNTTGSFLYCSHRRRQDNRDVGSDRGDLLRRRVVS